MIAASESKSIEDFNDKDDWGTAAYTAGAGIFSGGMEAYGQWSSNRAAAKAEAKAEANEGMGNKTSQKTYQTYTKTNPETGEVYTGRTSGTGAPKENVAARDRSHHMTSKGFGPAIIDESSTSKDVIRGREQMMIDHFGGAKSMGGTSGNAINGISPNNPKYDIYMDAAKKEFG